MNRFEKRSLESYNQKADDYDNTPEGKFTLNYNKMLLETVKIQDGNAVLDVACGNGRLLGLFADKYTIDGYGTDISDKMIEQAKTKNPSMMFSIGTCEQLPFADNIFDVITVSAAYHHFPDVAKFAKEAYRVLKANGTIYIAELFYPTILRAIGNLFIPLSSAGDVKIYSPNEIMKTLKDAGFQKADYTTNGHMQIVNACRL